MSDAAIMTTNDRVAIELGEDGVAEVRFTRADKMNALDPEMFTRHHRGRQHPCNG